MTRQITVHIDGIIFAKQVHGGISRNFVNLMNALDSRQDARVVLHQGEGVDHIDGLGAMTIDRLQRAMELRPMRIFRAVNRLLTQRKEDVYWKSLRDGVFHSSFYTSPRGMELPQVLSMQDVIFEDYPEMFGLPRHLRHIEDKRHAVERCTAILTPSQFSLDRTKAHYDISGKCTRVVPYAVDPLFRTKISDDAPANFRQRFSPSRPFLLHVGSRYLHKNVERLLAAFADWQGRREFSLVLAGGGVLSQEEQVIIRSLGIEDDVVVIPRLENDELLLAYHAAAGFVFPSLSEGFGFPVLEALACGTPVACARAGSLEEVGRQFPVYFEPTDIEDIRRALDAIVCTSKNDVRWEDARTMALARTWDHVASDCVSLYEQAINA